MSAAEEGRLGVALADLHAGSTAAAVVIIGDALAEVLLAFDGPVAVEEGHFVPEAHYISKKKR